MKKILLLFTSLIIVNIFLFSLSGNILNQISATLNKTQEVRFLIYTNLRLQRSLALFTAGVSTKNDQFITEAKKILNEVQRSFERIPDANKEIKNFSKDISEIAFTLEASEKDKTLNSLLSAMDKIENVSYRLSVLESNEWTLQLQTSEKLLNQYENLNLLINFLIIAITLILSAMTIFYYRKFNLEKAIAKENQLKSNLLSSLSEAIFVTDTKGKILSCNQASQLLTGINSLLLIGKEIKTIFPMASIESESLEKSKRFDFDEVIAKGKTYNHLLIGTFLKGKYHFLSFNVQPVTNVHDDGSFSMIFTVNDMSDVVEGQKLIKIQQQKLLEASRSDLIAQMAGGIAHEINNPLTAISNSMELLELKSTDKALVDAEDVKKSTKKVMTIVDRISGIVNGMLALSRKKEMTFEKAQLSKIIKTATDFSQVILHQHNVGLLLDSNNIDVFIECNHIQISQVLINLIKNSVDAIKDLEEKWVKIEVEQNFTGIKIYLTDSGKGISAELKEKILLPFFTSKETGAGTGLGLSISKNIIESHHGELSISENSEHTQFVIFLPFTQPASIAIDL